jgi:hypothetical protein
MTKHNCKIVRKWKSMGKHFGFPICCISSFCYETTTRSQRRAGNNSGFLPCKKHSKLVLLKEITLESLIKNRIEKMKFRSSSFVVRK